MWHIHALSSVTKLSIQSIYPNFNAYIRPLLNKVVFPREGVTTLHSIPIMWTRAAPMRGAGPWSPNHFVPCVSVQPIQSRVPETPSKDVHHLACSIESSPPAKSAPWPAPRQATGSQIHTSSKESRPPAKSAPWPAPRQATGSQIHTSSKESRPPAKSAPWPAPRQATGSQIHTSSKESRPPAKSACTLAGTETGYWLSDSYQ